MIINLVFKEFTLFRCLNIFNVCLAVFISHAVLSSCYSLPCFIKHRFICSSRNLTILSCLLTIILIESGILLFPMFWVLNCFFKAYTTRGALNIKLLATMCIRSKSSITYVAPNVEILDNVIQNDPVIGISFLDIWLILWLIGGHEQAYETVHWPGAVFVLVERDPNLWGLDFD